MTGFLPGAGLSLASRILLLLAGLLAAALLLLTRLLPRILALLARILILVRHLESPLLNARANGGTPQKVAEEFAAPPAFAVTLACGAELPFRGQSHKDHPGSSPQDPAVAAPGPHC